MFCRPRREWWCCCPAGHPPNHPQRLEHSGLYRDGWMMDMSFLSVSERERERERRLHPIYSCWHVLQCFPISIVQPQHNAAIVLCRQCFPISAIVRRPWLVGCITTHHTLVGRSRRSCRLQGQRTVAIEVSSLRQVRRAGRGQEFRLDCRSA